MARRKEMALPEFEMRRGEPGSEEGTVTYDVRNGGRKGAKKQTIALIGCVIVAVTRGGGRNSR